ncbi:radical SAM protein [Streptomyces sp. MNP-20]|uniref:radical SAM protein n=1 Tax=Streptomyces sp. MNP-20 TaxID=2721165 RepID=UPI001552017A|nr:radical SAM protein [Streptomyces sp. MNP-20]
MTSQVADYRFTSHGWNARTPRQQARVHTYKGAYVSITSLCNTDICTYCYARDQKTEHHTMPLTLFSEVLDMLQDVSDFPEVYLVGGEPTIVPDLPGYIGEIERRGWSTTVYTNGGFNAKRRDVLLASPAVTRMSFHYDELLFDRYAWLRPRWRENLAAMAETCETSVIGVIDGPDFPFTELVDLAAEYGASFTWIFSTPTSGGTPFLGLHEMRELGPAVQRMLLHAEERGVQTSPDLPVPLCIFEPDFLRRYAEKFALVRRCKPFAYFHVDGRVSYCTAMPVFTAPRPQSGAELATVIEAHRAQDTKLKQRPSFPECVTCEMHLKQKCQGGCMTYKVYQEEKPNNVVAVDILPTAPADYQA